MDHERAVTIQAAERYILKELSDTERDDFEAHFFTCPACAEQVRETAAFVENAVTVLRAAPRARWPGRLLIPQLGWAAAAVLLLVAGWQFAHLRQVQGQLAVALAPQTILSTTLLPATRSEASQVTLTPGAAFFELVLDLDPDQQAPQYAYAVRRISGDLIASGSAAAPAPGAGLHLLLPANRFASGSYRMTLQPTGPGPAQQYHFRVH